MSKLKEIGITPFTVIMILGLIALLLFLIALLLQPPEITVTQTSTEFGGC